MSTDIILSSLTDEELLHHVYNSKALSTDMVLELAARLEHLLDEVTRKPQSVDDVVRGVLDGLNS